MVNVVHLAETIKGGVATYLSDISAERSAIGNDKKLIYLLPEAQKESATGIIGETHYFEGGSRVKRIFSLVNVFFKKIEVNNVDVVHAHSSGAGIALLIIWPLVKIINTKVKFVYCAHGWSSTRKLSPIGRACCIALDKLIVMASDIVIDISRNEKKHSELILKSKKSVLIKNAIDIDCYKSIINLDNIDKEKNNIDVLFVGRFDEQKGFDLLLKALDLGLIKENITFSAAGDSVVSKREVVGHQDRVNFLGWCAKEKLKILYAEADLTIMPSRWEGFGLVALESLLSGTPVLASSVGDLPEIIHDCGVACEINDEYDLAEALNSITVNKIISWKQNIAKRDFSEYSRARLACEIGALYDSFSNPQ